MKAVTWMVSLAIAVAPAMALASADKIAMIVQQQREIREESAASTGAYARFGSQALDRMHAAQEWKAEPTICGDRGGGMDCGGKLRFGAGQPVP